MKYASLLLSVVTAAAVPGDPHARGDIPDGAVKGAQGLVVHAGATSADLAAAVTDGRGCLVHVLADDEETIKNIRTELLEGGLHGRVTVSRWDGTSLPYVDDLVNVLVIEKPGSPADAEVMRVLVPNGTAHIRSGGSWKRVTKPRPGDIDEWTHWLHGPDNNAVSADRRVGISRSLQWHMPPRWSRHHNLPAGFNALVSGGGRIYYLVDRAPNAVYGPGAWDLVARDAFNGLELWRRKIPDLHMKAWGADTRYGGRVGRFHGAPDYQLPRRLVVAGDRLLATLGFHAPVSVLDGATGRVLEKYPETRSAGEIIYQDGVLYVARNTYTPAPGKEIMAVDTQTGKTLWKNADYTGIAAAVGYQAKHTNAFLTAGREHLFLCDENDIVALSKKDGRAVWKKRMPLTDEIVGDIDYRYSNFCTLVYHDKAVFFCQIHPGKQNMNRWEMKKLHIEARDAATGKRRWDFTGGTLAHVTPADLFVTGGKAWTLDPSLTADGNCDARLLGLDCRTGDVATQHLLEKITHSHHHRCYRNKATERFYLMGEEGIEYIDFASGAADVHYWLRGACRYGIMPANGFIYVPPHNCGCYLGTLVNGLMALKARPSLRRDRAAPGRLVTGPAFDFTPGPAAAAGKDDWPMFRRDPARSGGTPAALPEKLSVKWTASPGGDLTAPIVVGDRMFTASPTDGMVCCLDAADGKRRWLFAADGPVTAPPTYREGRLVFGTRAGTLYAITAGEGTLIWRFGTGPDRVHIAAFGRLESPWPLNGSPIVMDGTVYCAAGRSMSLDSGIYFYAVDLRTGKLLAEANLQTDTATKGETKNNFLADMLVSDGAGIYMKSIRFDPNDITNYRFMGQYGRRGSAKAPPEILRCQTDMLDDSWLNCCFWAYRGCRAQQLVFDETAVYGTSGPSKIRWGGSYAHDVYRPGSGYRLQKWTPGAGKGNGGKKAKKKRNKRGRGIRGEWKNVTVPIRARSMIVTRNRLCLAGTPDENPTDDFWAAYENRRGAVLLAVSKEDGTITARYSLDAEPVYNGIAAAGGRLYLCLRNRAVVCFGDGPQ